MRRKAFIGALLLPLPFAALPVVAIFIGGSGAESHTLVVESTGSTSVNVSTIVPPGAEAPLAYGVTGPHQGGCDSAGRTES
jgi:hypothetical protein